jgi:hypothetical protein
LHLIQELLPLSGERPYFRWSGRGSERQVRFLESSVKTIHLGPKGQHFSLGILVLAERRDSPNGLVGVYLSRQVHMNHLGVAVEQAADALVLYGDDARRIRTDLVQRDIEIGRDRDAFNVDGDLFERVALGGFRGESLRILARVTRVHPVFPFGLDRPNTGARFDDRDETDRAAQQEARCEEWPSFAPNQTMSYIHEFL